MVGAVFFIRVGLAGHVTRGFPGRAMALPFKQSEYDTSHRGYVKCDDKTLTNGAPLNYCQRTARVKSMRC